MSSTDQHEVFFHDKRRKALCPSNPKYPQGCCIDASHGMSKTCDVKLPYPAPNCGVMVITCKQCGNKYGVTVAGRPDDPHTVRMACYMNQLGSPNEVLRSPTTTDVLVGGNS